jgi:hypothetical protein
MLLWFRVQKYNIFPFSLMKVSNTFLILQSNNNSSTINNSTIKQTDMDLTNILGALTGNDAIDAISQNLKIDQKQVSSVVTAALPYLLGAMQKNASSQAGAASLADALGYHAGNAGNIVNNLKGADLIDGSKILGHIFGGDLSSVLGGISKKTGVASNAVSNILASIAPSLLAILGKRNGNAGAAGLGGLLGAILGGGTQSQSTGGLGGLGSILGGLGSLFGKK